MDDEITDLLNRDMDKVAWGDKFPRRPIRNKRHSEWAKNDPDNLATLARARVGTQLGGPNIRRCTALNRKTGLQCKCPALRGEKVCRFHAKGAVLVRLRERRLAEGRPMDKANALAARNMRAVLKKNLLPYELLTNPQFQAVMKLVIPRWFGGEGRAKLGKDFTRRDLKNASLLSREYALAWTHATSTGDWTMWANTVMKAREAGFGV